MMNLRSEIRMQNLSECPSFEPRLNTNEDTESQFTTKYFDIPTRFMLKRNKSTDTFTATNDLETKMTHNFPIREEDTHTKNSVEETEA